MIHMLIDVRPATVAGWWVSECSCGEHKMSSLNEAAVRAAGEGHAVYENAKQSYVPVTTLRWA